MKIYFAGSIRGGRDDKELYFRIIKLLSQHGTVLTEHIGSKALSAIGVNDPSDEYIHKRDMKWLQESDVVVAEVTTPSLGVGYEVAKAEDLGKRILCMFRPSSDRKLSAMLAGSKSLTIKEYGSEEDLAKILEAFFK